MDEYRDSFVNRDDPIPTIILNNPSPRPQTPTPSSSSHKQPESHDSYHSDTEIPSRSRGIRGRISALKDKARIQDHLVEKLLAQVVPLDDAEIPQDDPQPGRTAKPNFTLATMSNNFRRFNSRIGVVFVFQARVIRLLAWRRPTHTLSFLAVYTFVCLDPSLLPLATTRAPPRQRPRAELHRAPRDLEHGLVEVAAELVAVRGCVSQQVGRLPEHEVRDGVRREHGEQTLQIEDGAVCWDARD
ncbi:hypothetical protein NUW58_g6432 [Xylaria curta]|uniref:Uncharacterized protein n=1 Tax=Xylaria curta TaxID=42375 RepID=A0ACC1NU67_9PEZI|nr:hypothetical protein NUW58_g6432 [Xylaria curta]